MAKARDEFYPGAWPPGICPPLRSVLRWTCIVLGALALGFGTLTPRTVRAEAQPLTQFRGGGLTITTQSPTLDKNKAFIDCSVSARGCYPLNRAACNDAGFPIRFTLGQPLSQAAPPYVGGTQSLYAFLSTTPSCIYSSNNAQVASNGNLIGTTTGMPSSSVFFNSGFTAFQFPNDLASIEPNTLSDPIARQFTTRDLLHLMGACPESGGTAIDLTPVYICVGIDGTGNKGGVNNGTTATSTTSQSASSSTSTNSSSGDLYGFLALQVDTSPPLTPTELSIKPKNGRAEVRVRYNASALDVYSLQVRYTADANDVSAGLALDNDGVARGCAAWTHSQSASIDVKGVADGNKLFNINNLNNGSTYSFCAMTSDFLLNNSAPTAVQTATPRKECDLFSCFDGELRVGFCASQDLPFLWSVVAVACAVVAIRRRVRRGPFVLMALAMAIGSGSRSAHAEPPTWLKSERPVSTEKGRPQGNVGGLPDSQTDKKRPFVVFGGGSAEQLDFSRKPPPQPLWMLEVTTGPYRPAIGRGQLQSLYRQVYQQGHHGLFGARPLRTRIAGAWFPFSGLTTGPYGSVGFWQASGSSRLCGTEAEPAECTAQTIDSSRPGNDTASLLLMPLSVGWQHTQDLSRLVRIPLGVGARLGYVAHVWWGRAGGRPSRYKGRRAQGMTSAPELSAHVALNLSQLTARGRQTQVHGLLVAEYTYVPHGALFGTDRAHRLDFGAPWIVTLGIRGQFLH